MTMQNFTIYFGIAILFIEAILLVTDFPIKIDKG